VILLYTLLAQQTVKKGASDTTINGRCLSPLHNAFHNDHWIPLSGSARVGSICSVMNNKQLIQAIPSSCAPVEEKQVEHLK